MTIREDEAAVDAALRDGRAVVQERTLTAAEMREIVETGPSVGVYGCPVCGGSGWTAPRARLLSSQDVRFEPCWTCRESDP